MGIGILIMLAVLAIPILLIVGLVILVVAPRMRRSNTPAPASSSALTTASDGGTCLHCGTGLQRAWAYCPQCGAPA